MIRRYIMFIIPHITTMFYKIYFMYKNALLRYRRYTSLAINRGVCVKIIFIFNIIILLNIEKFGIEPTIGGLYNNNLRRKPNGSVFRYTLQR